MKDSVLNLLSPRAKKVPKRLKLLLSHKVKTISKTKGAVAKTTAPFLCGKKLHI
jgi:hypothetical protein